MWAISRSYDGFVVVAVLFSYTSLKKNLMLMLDSQIYLDDNRKKNVERIPHPKLPFVSSLVLIDAGFISATY